MNMAHSGDLRVLIRKLRSGDSRARLVARNEVFANAYYRLRRIAATLMNSERTEHTLQATALVHEAYFKLERFVESDGLRDVNHFFCVARRAMTQVLVEHARARNAQKRVSSGECVRHALDDLMLEIERKTDAALVELHEAAERLARECPTQHSVMTLRFFEGLTNSETARALRISTSSVERHWRAAKSRMRMWIKRARIDG